MFRGKGKFDHLVRCVVVAVLTLLANSASAAPVFGSGLPAVLADAGSVSSTLTFPGTGSITAIELYFEFTHECEDNLFSTLTSPNGSTSVVQDRGLNRCSGVPTLFNSRNSLILQTFGGEEANGQWIFTMSDISPPDGNTGTLDVFSLEIVTSAVDSVPEPTALVLLISALAGLIVARRHLA